MPDQNRISEVSTNKFLLSIENRNKKGVEKSWRKIRWESESLIWERILGNKNKLRERICLGPLSFRRKGADSQGRSIICRVFIRCLRPPNQLKSSLLGCPQNQLISALNHLIAIHRYGYNKSKVESWAMRISKRWRRCSKGFKYSDFIFLIS